MTPRGQGAIVSPTLQSHLPGKDLVVPPTFKDSLREHWEGALAQWESALNLSENPADSPRSAQVKEKRRGFPMFPGITIVLTGEEGAGKSVLARTILSKIDPSAKPTELPSRSSDKEVYKFFQRRPQERKMRVQLTVIPGQGSEERRIAEGTYLGSRPAKALIHAVCWGRNRTWEWGERLITVEQLQSDKPGADLEDVFAEYKQRELGNFCRLRDERLRSAWQDQHGIWLIIAVTMCDLFKDRLNEARDYYIPTSAELRAKKADAKADAAMQAAKAATAEAGTQASSTELRQKAEQLRQIANQARKQAESANKACNDPERTGFARALEDLVGSVGPDRFQNVAVLPVSSVQVPRNFGIDIEQDSKMEVTEISQLLDHFVTKVGEFAREEESHGR
jgi:hypothetical protein